MMRRPIAIALLAGVACAAFAEDKDPIKEKLFAAKVAYDKEMRQFRKQVEEWLDKREDTLRKAGDKKALDQLKEERKAYEENGELPKSIPSALQQRYDRAKKKLETAYTDAVKEYTKAKKDDLASAVETEWNNLTKPPGINLLALVKPKEHRVLGEWKKDGDSLVGDNPTFPGVCMLPYEPGEEYDLEVNAQRLSGKEYFGLQLVAGGRRVCVAIDTYPSKGYMSGLGDINGQGLLDNGTAVKGGVIKNKQPFTIVYSVRNGKIDVKFDGKTLLTYKGEFNRFSIHSDFRVPNNKALAIQIGYTSPFQIDRLIVTPIKGKGTILK